MARRVQPVAVPVAHCAGLALGLLLAGQAAASPPGCSPATPAGCLDGVSSAVTAPDALRVGLAPGSLALGERQERAQGEAGLAAGETLAGWNLWADAGTAQFGGDTPITGPVPTAAYDASLRAFTFGADRLFGERVLAGLGLGYESLRSRTFYNGGGQEGDGVLVVPYAAVLLGQYLSLDAALGYAWLSSSQTRVDTGRARVGPATPGAILSADYDAERWFAAANLNAFLTRGVWTLGGRLGVLYTQERQDGYSERGGGGARTLGEREVDLSQAVVAADLSRRFGNLEPYAALAYRSDLGREDGAQAGGLPANTGTTLTADEDEFELALGLRYLSASGVSAGAEWLRTLAREDFDNDAVRLTLRLPL